MKQILQAALLAICVLIGAWGPTAEAASERHVAFISDLHLGAGRDGQGLWRRTEDFRWQADLDAFLLWLSRTSGERADLILTGDVFELWQSPSMTCSSNIEKPDCQVPDCNEEDTDLGCSEAEALARLQAVLKQHADFVAAVRDFARKGSNQVVFVPGNHDEALLFPSLRKALLEALAGLRVTVSESGHWLSADGLIYADHGHQWDLVNRFPRWPRPFITRAGRQHLAKPWGENMVQQFYNQYEAVFPIIDNLSDEKAGVQFAVDQASLGSSAEAVGRFFRFFLFQQSLRQALGALSRDENAAWDRAWVRAQAPDFFIDTLAGQPALLGAAQAALKAGTLVLRPEQLGDTEIDATCTAKARLSAARPCRAMDGKLGALLLNTLFSEDQLRVAYLQIVLPEVKGASGPWPTAYVAGHSHLAATTRRLALGEMPGGSVSLNYANTGAFQRVASPEQIRAILEGPAKGRARSPLDLQPEDLPPCYNFVWIPPYANGPVPTLWNWAQQAGSGKFEAGRGTCLSRPL